jgi:hypothetical protein
VHSYDFATRRDNVDEWFLGARAQTCELTREPVAGVGFVPHGMFAAQCGLMEKLVEIV